MHTLTLIESINLVKKYGITFANYAEVKTEKELKTTLEKIDFPIAMKVVSKSISHKTEAGGVKINITNFSQAKKVLTELKKLRGFEKIIIQQMIRGTEIIIGGKRDVQFGPTILVGLGGIYVEVFKDFQIGICPVSRGNAKEMIEKLKSYPILKGTRGKKGVNLDKLIDTILKVSNLMMKEKNLQELDLNPLIATEKEIIAVDARAILK